MDSLISGLSSIYLSISTAATTYVLQTTALNNLTIPTGNLNINNNRITGLANGIAATDAATV